ncbi:ABC transporter substrate-binding protein [Leucobacter sp. UCMA 4100]|uniref:ABC transporter substrate-binding protein n=1 Tax=Leucobacter sp. UCMA 4100 TaxID=2810534 RepID=UPI0022EB487A|nr:ABC transporter substrate-binding protein [Leucobacter sp. UCMA 4100]MDA3147306.1 ABC transporter substrate-binding protein [Leucobacter sp. UCMA 4100]
MKASHMRKGMTLLVAAMLTVSLASCASSEKGNAGGNGKGDSSGLTLGMVGSTTDKIDPYSQTGSGSQQAVFTNVYEGLTARNKDGEVEYVLAEKIEPNATNDEWIITLRDNVKLHNGEQFTSEDAVESLKQMIDPEYAWAFNTQLSFLQADGLEIIDDLTFKMVLDEPFGPLPDVLAMDRLVMRSIKGDATVDKPAGTGPYKIDTFTAGQEAKLVKNEDYWGEPATLDSVTISFLSDQTAVTNAVRGGQIDVAHGIPFAEVPALEGTPGLDMLVSDTAAYPVVPMRMDMAPFDDERVREAMRLAIDRQRIVDNAYGGYASVANDYIGQNTACPAPDVPQREQDLGKAKKLVEEAGATGASVELVTDAAFPGMAEMAQLIAQDAEKIGITVQVKKLDVGTFLDRWLEWPFFIGHTSSPYIITAKGHFLPGGSENGSHMDDAEYNEIAEKLYATSDPEEQCTYITQMQTIEHERGGYLIPIYGQSITVHSERVKGLTADLYGRAAYQFAGVTVE